MMPVIIGADDAKPDWINATAGAASACPPITWRMESEPRLDGPLRARHGVRHRLSLDMRADQEASWMSLPPPAEP
jgi:hypothetical protein